MSQPENPPAFPGDVVERIPREGGFVTQRHTVSGMSLRDYFAGQALTGAFANPHGWPTEADAPEMVRRAYVLADAMLAAREAK